MGPRDASGGGGGARVRATPAAPAAPAAAWWSRVNDPVTFTVLLAPRHGLGARYIQVWRAPIAQPITFTTRWTAATTLKAVAASLTVISQIGARVSQHPRTKSP